jgi:hypothetical protein
MRARSIAGVVLMVPMAMSLGCRARDTTPTPRRFHHESGIVFDTPPGWTLHDASASFDGGSIIAVLGTQPVDPRCGTRHVDINCYNERALEPGTIAVVVGTGSFRGGTIFDDRTSGPLEIGRERVEIDGLPAIVYRYGPGGYHGQDEGLGWQIAFPKSVLRVYGIEARLRGPGVERMRAQLDALIASLRFDGVAPPVSREPGDADAVVETALGELDRRMRRAYVARPEHVSWYACFPGTAGTLARRVVTLGPGGPLAAPREIACRFTVAPEGSRFWRATLDVDDGAYAETMWLASDGTIAGTRASGTPPS